MKRFLIVMIIFLVCFSTYGRIGETLEQCKERYGEPVSINENSCIFIKGEFMIRISFYEGKAENIVYCKSEKDILGNYAELSELEIKTLLAVNGEEWEKKDVIGSFLEDNYQTKDGKLYALYNTLKHMLLITTIECVMRQQAETEKKEKEQMEGL